MKLYSISILAFLFLLNVQEPVKAQENPEVKSGYNMECIKAANPWIGSYNASGLIFNRNRDFSVAALGYQYREGNFRNLWDEKSANHFRLFTESFRNIKKLYFYGMFDFHYAVNKDKAWSSVLDPYRTPLFPADTTPGKQNLERYKVKGGVGYEINPNWAIGVNVDFEVVSNAKDKDARNKNVNMNLKLHPGVMYNSPVFKAGLNFIYERMTEKVDIRIYGAGLSHEIFNFDPLWFYTSDMLSDGGTSEREYREDLLGGAIQLEVGGDNWRFFNQFAAKFGTQEVFKNKAGDSRGGEIDFRLYEYEGGVNVGGELFNHCIRLSADFNSSLIYDNLQYTEVIDQTSHIVQYGRKNKAFTEGMNGDISYTLFRRRGEYCSRWNAMVGAKGYIKETQYKLYPVDFEQKVKYLEIYAAFNKNILFEKGMLDCGLKAAYGQGSGTEYKISGEDAGSAPDIEKYKQNQEALKKEYAYLTSDRLNGALSVRYSYFINKQTGFTCFAEAKADYRRGLNTDFKNKDRMALSLMIGMNF